jgi:hypothetical protein
MLVETLEQVGPAVSAAVSIRLFPAVQHQGWVLSGIPQLSALETGGKKTRAPVLWSADHFALVGHNNEAGQILIR